MKTGWVVGVDAHVRPPFFNLVFWTDIVVVVVVRAAHGVGLELVPLCLALALLIALWRYVPWDARTAGRRRELSPLFLLAALTEGVIDGYGTAAPILLVALANVALLYGISTGAALLALATGAQLGSMLLISGATWASATVQTVVFAMMSGFVLAVAAAVLDAGKHCAAALERGFGLSSLAERVRDVGGRLTVQSTEGQGLMLRVEVP